MNERFSQVEQDSWKVIQILRAIKTMVIGLFIMGIIIVILMLVGLQDALAFQCKQQWVKSNLVVARTYIDSRQISKKNKRHGFAVHLGTSTCVKPKRIKLDA